MKVSTLLAAGAVALGMLSFAAQAQDDPQKFWQTLSPEAQAALRDQWEGMSPEEQQDWVQHQKDRRAAFESMSPEEQARIKNHREQRREEWASMSPEEREQSIADYKQKKADVQARWD
jgi:Spy/CpxP family protein refolding chaperone